MGKKSCEDDLDPTGEDQIAKVWAEEAERRYLEIASGELEAVPSAVVLEEARARSTMNLFTWNREKTKANQRKHQVSFEEATTVFSDPAAEIHSDPAHSDNELREIIIGYSSLGRLVLVSFTEREGYIRLVSARRANPRERKSHEEVARR